MKLRPAYYYTENLHRILNRGDMKKEDFFKIHEGIEHYIAEYQRGKRETDSISVAAGFQKQVQESIDENKDSEYGKQIKCGKGCSHCCNYHVDISDDEAELLVTHAKEKSIPIDVARLEKQKDKNVNTWGELKYAERKCVFLDDKGSCKVYKYRPVSCRVLQVITPPDYCSAENEAQQVGSFSILDVDVISTAIANATKSDSMARLILEKL